METRFSRETIFGDDDLPRAVDAVALGQARAKVVSPSPSRFLSSHAVSSEIAYKRNQSESGAVTFHAQVGWRDPTVTAESMARISKAVAEAGGHVDRYGICLDWSMGYPSDQRDGRAKGTGLILHSEDHYAQLANATDAAAHFGDFVIGMPAALENTEAVLRAGATTVGNLGQYFTFRLPDWDDDVWITEKTVAAIALCAASKKDILIHSNLDDGFAARFSDLACTLGAVLVERYVVEDLLGARLGHCYGHTFSDLVTRQAFHLGLHRLGGGPGTMIYGNTTSFTTNEAESYAVLGAYLTADVASLRWAPSGHAVTPIPVTEAERIPTVDEIVDAQIFALRLSEKLSEILGSEPPEDVSEVADKLIAGARQFADNVLSGLADAGIDMTDAVEVLLALRRIDAAALERAFGPGAEDARAMNGRAPIVATSVLAELSEAAEAVIGNLDQETLTALSKTKPRVCIATTDVHEYGKRVIEEVCRSLELPIIDGGIATDPDDLADLVCDTGAVATAISTYNGVAVDYVRRLQRDLAARGATVPVYVGGRMNGVPDGSNTGIPVDVEGDLQALGAIVCRDIEEMLRDLSQTGDP